MTAGVYAIRHRSVLRAYVGSSRNLALRHRSHVNALNGGKHTCPRLQADWISDGADEFEFIVLEELESDGQILDDAERRWTLELGRAGFNIYGAQIAGRTNRSSLSHRVPQLRARRLLEALTQQELAVKAGVRRLTIGRLERGAETRPTTLRKLADALGCLPRELIEPAPRAAHE